MDKHSKVSSSTNGDLKKRWSAADGMLNTKF